MARPGINDRKELAGKKIGTVADGGIDAREQTNVALTRAVSKGCVKNLLAMAPSRTRRLLSGKVDVVVGTPPECIDAIRHGCGA